MGAGHINLNDGQVFNLGFSAERAEVVGTDLEFTSVVDVPNGYKYPGKRIFDKDLGILYKIDKDGLTAIRQENVLVEVSEDNTTWYRYDQSATPVNAKYIGFSNDGDTDNRFVIRVLNINEISNILEDINDLTDELAAHKINPHNPHALTGSVIPWSSDDGESIEDQLNSKLVAQSLGYPGDILVTADDGQRIVDAYYGGYSKTLQKWLFSKTLQLNNGASLEVGGSAHTVVETIIASSNNFELGLGGDEELYLKNHDKYHVTVQTDSINVKGFSDDNEIQVGKYFSIVFAKATVGNCTITFENIPWGAKFDDIVIGQGDKSMVTGYVYSRDIYLAKRVNFDNQ